VLNLVKSVLVEVNVEALREFRRQRVLTITDLAEKAGVSKNTVSKAENGGSVYPSTIRKLARALGVEPRELIKS
jgi:transcriptional regulator with XRE-family HTH domain